MFGDQQSYEVWFVHWNNGPSDPVHRSGPFSRQKAHDEAKLLLEFNPKTLAKPVLYLPLDPALVPHAQPEPA